MKMDPSLIKDKLHMSMPGKRGDDAKIGFIQDWRYNTQLSERVSSAVENITSKPDTGYGELNLLCDKYGSDKGSCFNLESHTLHPYKWRPHTYTNIYEALFDKKRYSVKNVFECGIGTNNEELESNMTSSGKPGASLRVWQDYFKNAKIHGADIDRECLFEEDRITTGWIDQTSPSAVKSYFDNLDYKFDVMIDDGLHTGQAAVCLFENSIENLSDDGVYIVEDLSMEGILVLQEYLSKKEEYVVKYIIMETPKMLNNNLIIISRSK